MKQLFRRIQRRREHPRRGAGPPSSSTPKASPPESIAIVTAATAAALPHGIPATVVVAPKTGGDDDATTVSRYTMDSRGHFAPTPSTELDEAIVQVAISAMALATQTLKKTNVTATPTEQGNEETNPTSNEDQMSSAASSSSSRTPTKRNSKNSNNNCNDISTSTDNEESAGNGHDEKDNYPKSNVSNIINNNHANGPTNDLSYHERQATMAVEQTNWQLSIFHYQHALSCLEQQQRQRQNDAVASWTNETLGTVSTILNNLAYASQVVRYAPSETIIRYYQAALSIKRHVYGKWHESTAKTLNNLGSTYYLNRQFHSAAAYYEEARDILRLLPKRHGANDLAHEIATIGSNLGDVHYCLHQYERANIEYRSSLRLRWNLFQDKSDGKITRLLEQIATTEEKINRQRMDLDDDGHSSVSSGRSRDSWNQEIEQLQTELSVDLEFLDELEQTVPIQMAKEKAIVFRELRHLTKRVVRNNDEEPPPVKLQGALVTEASADPVHWSRNVVSPDNTSGNMDVTPIQTTTTTHGQQLQTVQEASSIPMGGEWTVLSHSPVKRMKSEDSSSWDKNARDHHQQQDHHNYHQSNPKEESSDRQYPLAYSEMSATILTAESTIMVTPPATPTRFALAVSQQRRGQHHHNIGAAPTTSPCRTLTQRERQAALVDVKTRLAQLRASRQPSNSNNNGPLSTTMVLV